ncbi:MAG: hypothetical protein WCD70_07270 [Alphaproteobacteria bacterium]
MNILLTVVQFLAGGFALVFVAALAVVALCVSRMRQNPSRASSQPSEFEKDHGGPGFFTEPDQWHT